MGTRGYKPKTPGTRFRTNSDFEQITADEPYKPLTKGRKALSARNNQGRVTVRWRGGAHKKLFREIDFVREKDGIVATVETIEYDPNRSCRIALVCYIDGERRYILAPLTLKVGDSLMSGAQAEIRDGNCLPLINIPVGSNIHNIEMKPGGGGQMARSAGVAAQLLAREGEVAFVKLPSGEVRKVPSLCRASLGQLSNIENNIIVIGKAGRSRWLGRMPSVRGVAQNPVDHPMGGGEGKTSGGRHPCSPWGQKSKGLKTRKKKQSDKYIVRTRKQKGLTV